MDPTTGRSRWLVILVLAETAALATVLGFQVIASPDIGFHLNSARWMVEHGSIPTSEPFVEPALGATYHDMQWLFQLALWLALQSGGTLAMVAFGIAMTSIAMALVVWRSWSSDRRLTLAAPALLLLFALGNTWEIRPHVVSWCFLNVVLLLLEQYDRDGDSKRLWLLAPVMAVWANCHSLYVLGLVAIGSHAAPWMYRAWRDREWSSRRRASIAALASVVATLATPFGLGGWRFSLTQLALLQQGSVFSHPSGVAEFQSPLRPEAYFNDQGQFALGSPLQFMQLLFAAIVIGFLVDARRARAAEWLRFVLFGYTFVTAAKNYGYFAVAVLPAAIAGWSTVADLVRARWPKVLAAARIAVAAAPPALAWLVLSGAFYAMSWSPTAVGHRFDASVLPIGASKVLARAPAGRGLNAFGDGGWIAYATRRPVFIDGRCELYGEAHFRRYLEFTDPQQFQRRLRELAPDWVLVPTLEIPLWQVHLARSSAWRVVYRDSHTALYLRDGFAPELPALGAPVEGDEYPVVDLTRASAILAAAALAPDAGWLDVLRGSAPWPMEAIRASASFATAAQPRAAAAWALHGLAEGRLFCADLWFNLAYVLEDLGQRELADECVEVLVLRRPGADVDVLRSELRASRAARRG